MSVYTTEIASATIPSDNPIHQRLLKAYLEAIPFVSGSVLELGCGEGRGIEEIINISDKYTGIDKIEAVIQRLKKKYPAQRFESGSFPPIPFPDNSFDTIITFQVIEHIKDDEAFVSELHRVLAPGGTALITTPNILMTLTRNPWHEREYTSSQLKSLCLKHFENVEMKGIAGNEKVIAYYNRNKRSVRKITKYDLLNLQYRLPNRILRLPYDLLNRVNRNSLQKSNDTLVTSISHQDYFIRDEAAENLDLFVILRK